MRYWLIALPREDIEHCIKIGTFGLCRKYVLGNVQPGDKLGCYVTKESKIIALGEATSNHYLDDQPVFLREGFFPDRINFQACKLSKSAEIDFKSIIEEMKFIKNLAYWSVYFSKGIVEINASDWKVISHYLATKSGSAETCDT
ncbi:MAG: EVE domain-containing protein [Candidatus Obscuribacterales bacterium]|nr:EVE domain-containing protein [Candidatus Obscuribacterales bacterium]